MSKISTGVRFDPDVVEAVDKIADETQLKPSHIYNELVRSRLMELGKLRYVPLFDPYQEVEKRQAGEME